MENSDIHEVEFVAEYWWFFHSMIYSLSEWFLMSFYSIIYPGVFPVTVYGDFLPRHIFYRLHAVCAYLRCLFVALCVLLMWPSFDVILADQVSIVIPVLKLKKSIKVNARTSFMIKIVCSCSVSMFCGLYSFNISIFLLFMQVVFYCHFPDLLLAKHTTLLRKIYRMPIDFIEERTTGKSLHFSLFHYSHGFLTVLNFSLISLFFIFTGMADLVLVNSKFTASTFARTFKHLEAGGVQPSVLYPAVNLDQFGQPHASK